MLAGALEIELYASVARLQKDMDDAKRAVGGAMADIEKAVGFAKQALVAFVGVATAGAFVNMVRGSIEAAAGMHDLSIQTGASVASLMAFKGIAATSNTSIDGIAGSMNKFAKNLAVANEESKGAGQAVKAIGLDFASLKSMKPEDQMLAVAKALDQFENGAGKSAVAMTLFGKEGAKMLPFLQDLADESGNVTAKLTKQEEEARKAQANMADAFTDNLTKIKKESEAWKKDLSMGMLPALYEFTQAFRDVTTGAGGVKESISKLSKDGTIAEWTRSAIYGVTYVMDAFEGLKAVVSSVGNYIGASAALIVEQFSLAWKVVTGLFKSGNVIDEINASMVRQRAISAGLADNLDQTWGAQTFGSKLRARMEELKGVAVAGKEAKKALDYGGNGGSTEAIDKELEKQAKLLAELAGLTGGFSEDWARLNAVYAAGKLTTEQLTAAQAALLAKQPAIQAATKAETEAEKAYTKEMEDQLQVMKKLYAEDEARTKSARGMLEQLEFEISLLGMTTEQRALANAERELERQGIVAGTEAYDKYITKIRQAVVDKSAMEQWQATWQSIDATAHDVFVNIFEGGQSAFKKLGSVLKASLLDWLYQMTVKKWIISIGASMSGGSALADVVGGGSGGGSLLGSGLSALGNSAVGSTVSGWFGGGAMAAANAATATGGSLAGGLYTTAAADSALAYGAAGTTAGMTGSSAAAAGGSSVLAAIPVWGWIALAAIAIASKAKGETRSGGQYSYDSNKGVASLLQGPSGGEIEGDVVKQSIAGTAGGINGLLKGMGSSAMLVGFQAGLESSDRGRGGVFSGGTLSTGATFGESGKGSNYEGTLYEQTSSHSVDAKTALENFTTDLLQGTVQALQAAGDIPKTIADMVQGVDAESLSSEAAKALVSTIQTTVSGVAMLKDALATMGLKELSFDAAAGLIAAAGGMDKLGASLSTYYDKFYSAEEKSAASIKATQAAFAKLGVTMPLATDGLRDWYRAQVDGLMAMDQTVAANAQATAGALALAGAVDQIAPATDGAVSSMMAFTDNVMKMVDGIHTSVSGSIFDMQYGLKDNQGKYGMLDTVAKGYDDKMRGATDINVIADMAQREIDTINKAWALLDATQQQDKLGEMTALLTKVDEFVTQSGADAISLKKAENAELATAVADAVEKAMETLANRLADTAIALAASTAKMEGVVSRPAQVSVTVTNGTGDEVAIS